MGFLKALILGLFVVSNFGGDTSADDDSKKREIINARSTSITFYFGPTQYNYVSYPLFLAYRLFKHKKFTHNRTTVFIPDYHEPQWRKSFYNVHAYNKLNKINFFMVNWGADMVKQNSQFKDPDEEELPPKLAGFLIKLGNHIGWDNLHVLAYAKGVRMAVKAALYIREKTNSKNQLTRLTYLDPPKSPIDLASKKDKVAKFVDAIHTDVDKYGTRYAVGHVDFWPNVGSVQPECNGALKRDPTCNRRQAYIYWAESVDRYNGPYFCGSQFIRDDNTLELSPDRIKMGIKCDMNAQHGSYVVQTNSRYPFARGGNC